MPAATGHEPVFDSCRKVLRGTSDRRRYDGDERSGPVLAVEPFHQSPGEIVPIQGLGRRAIEMGVLQNRRQQLSIAPAAGPSLPPSSMALPVRRRTQSSSGALPGPVSNATMLSSAPIHVTLATPPRLSTASGRSRSWARAA